LGLVRQIMTRINKLGNEIKFLQKQEKKRDLERHCEILNKENNPKKFFQTFKKISEPLLNSSPTPMRSQAITDEWGNSARLSQEKADLFANRLKKVHQEPDYHGFNEGWKASVERYLCANKDSFQTDPRLSYFETEDGDESVLLQEVSIEELRQNLQSAKINQQWDWMV
jgi:uncharacterized protein (UPF0335 family)